MTFTINLTIDEAKLLRECLAKTMAKGDALTFGIDLEDKLYEFYSKQKNENMGFLTNIVSATIKTALTPVAVVKDVVNVAVGEDADATKNLLESAREDASDAIDNLGDGEF